MTSPSPVATDSSAVPSYRTKLPSLTGLRFIAAALVFFFHATFSDPPMNPFADQSWEEGFRWLFSKAGWMGVSFFFVLSGFVLTWSARPGDTLSGFWRRRLLKIFPNHVVMWAFAMVLFAGATTPVSAWLPNLLLIHSWFPQHGTFISVNPPSWSLCSELLFYLLFPLLLRPVLRIKERALWVWAAAMVAGMLAVQLVTDFLMPQHPPTPEGFGVSLWEFWFGYNFPPVRMFEFVLGMILARLVMTGAAPRVGIVPAALLCVAGYAAAMAVPFLYGLNLMTVIPIALLICAVARADIEGTRTVLRGRAMQWLGEVSFGFYLAQYVVMYSIRTSLMDERLFSPLPAVLVLLGFFFATLLAGWLLLVCVERPVMRRWARPAARTTAPRDEEPQPVPALH
ncbi:acyltransferase family protein [Streptomyces sp. NRRL B-3648]|uniref:acyltransferase family protein n=1 Tax=Streptomyces sp. NRRL B-3648 TaxID=1519493 RepID=UPI0006AFC1BA|nr:acyltransferase [Streptomyces sp. NRRL B-3648]KOX07580.1 acyltransferase [Streptomyces sp. NRRL B-3648]